MSSESHNEAISIEHTLRNIYNCDRFGFGGNIDADAIEINPVQSYMLGLAPIYINAKEDKRKEIDSFIESLYEYENKSIDTVGVDIVEKLTKRFEKIIK